MIAFHADGKLILQQAFKTKSDHHCITAYNAIMTRLAAWGLSVDLQILDNEASSAYKEAITFKWNATFQLVPPNMHCRNRAERTIRTFKNHFLAILAGIDAVFPPYLWDLLLPQAELTLNLLRQATLNPRISAWEFFQGPFDFNKMPLGPVGCRVLIHAKPATQHSWDFCAKNGFYIGRGSSGSSPPLFFVLAGKLKIRKQRKRGKIVRPRTDNHCHFRHPIFQRTLPPTGLGNNPHRCAIQSPIMATRPHGAHCAACGLVA
jgi:hypothetical protein